MTEIPKTLRVGTAGWSIPAAQADRFPGKGSHLQRYSQRLPAVEINSSFYRPHRTSTYARWAASVPADFRFAVKVPKEITHTRRLANATEPLARFLEEVSLLGPKLGPLLIQLPPSLVFHQDLVSEFLQNLRNSFAGDLACEPRHPSWFTDAVDAMLSEHRVARVAADPAPVPRAAEPGGWPALTYFRLHGSPRMYYSPYPQAYLERLRHQLSSLNGEVWCIFDNTAEGAATHDALVVAA
ncbi:DUF72 domain-containing protein [Belnapia sp. T6]|uniref:DUF72 domain-containing protein n=1 Tax=Belnapia mucosa TaxID=2804532 RepID=A0ABS1VG00_9PROT|nr:DUF72 domain-containing protein [Belnapia mucosa]MBL6459353.1 DUF72 domain-containing protein [Belnapia mucosa]